MWSRGTYKSTFQLETLPPLIGLNVESEGCIVGSVEMGKEEREQRRGSTPHPTPTPARLSSKAGALFDPKPVTKAALCVCPTGLCPAVRGGESGQGSVFCVTLRKKGQFTGCRQGHDPRCACRPASASGRISPQAKETGGSAECPPLTHNLSLQRKKQGRIPVSRAGWWGPQHPARRSRLQKTGLKVCHLRHTEASAAASPIWWQPKATEDVNQGWSAVGPLGG